MRRWHCFRCYYAEPSARALGSSRLCVLHSLVLLPLLLHSSPARAVHSPSPPNTGTLDFDDFLAQSKAMGRASQMAGAANAMGMTNSIGEMEAAKDKMAQRSKLVEAMTTIERKTPALFVGTDADAQERKQRVADSCGVDAEEVQKFINEFVLMRSAAMKFSSGMDQEQIKFEMAKEQRDMGDPISRRARRMLDRKDKSQGKKKKSGRKGSVGRGFS